MSHTMSVRSIKEAFFHFIYTQKWLRIAKSSSQAKESKGMSLVSWARKEVDRFRLHKGRKTLLLPPPIIPLKKVKEVVIEADLHCKKCQLRIADEMSRMEGGMESMVVHISEKKVTITATSETKYE